MKTQPLIGHPLAAPEEVVRLETRKARNRLMNFCRPKTSKIIYISATLFGEHTGKKKPRFFTNRKLVSTTQSNKQHAESTHHAPMHAACLDTKIQCVVQGAGVSWTLPSVGAVSMAAAWLCARTLARLRSHALIDGTCEQKDKRLTARTNRHSFNDCSW